MNIFVIVALVFFILLSIFLFVVIYNQHKTLENFLNIFAVPLAIVSISIIINILVTSSQSKQLDLNTLATGIFLLVDAVAVFLTTFRTGKRGVWLTLSIIPILNLVTLLLLNLTSWPIEKTKAVVQTLEPQVIVKTTEILAEDKPQI